MITRWASNLWYKNDFYFRKNLKISCTEACKCHDAGLCQNPSNDVGEIEEESQDVEILEGENENEEN